MRPATAILSTMGTTVNREKTKVIIFTKSDPQIPLLFSCGNVYIDTIDKYEYLGVFFS